MNTHLLAKREQRHELLEKLFLSVVANLNPAERTAQALADIDWRPEKTVVVAVGKAALSMASGALTHLTSNDLALAGGVVVGPEHVLATAQQMMGLGGDMNLEDEIAELLDEAEGDGDDPESGDGGWPEVCTGGHPLPDERSIAAAAKASAAVGNAPADAEILALISGGASALLAMPAPGLTLEDKLAVVQAVAASGYNRPTVNMVRKHLSAIKGGQLAAMSPVPVTTLVVSDVVGDDVTAVGSGPTLPDPSNVRQACDVMAAAMGWGAIPWRVRAYLETVLAGEQPDTPTTCRPEDRVGLLAGTGAMVDVAVALADGAGMTAKPFARDLSGDVDKVAKQIAVQVRRIAVAGTDRPLCFVGGGESTVALSEPSGVGGRAQHLALLVAREITGLSGVSVLVASSDGIDGNSDAAGAVVDGMTWELMYSIGIDPEIALTYCDSGTALDAIGATVVTGPTEINHADLVLITAGI